MCHPVCGHVRHPITGEMKGVQAASVHSPATLAQRASPHPQPSKALVPSGMRTTEYKKNSRPANGSRVFCICHSDFFQADLPDVFLYGSVVYMRGSQFKKVHTDFGIKFLQGRLETDVICLVGFHMGCGNDATDTTPGTASESYR